MKRHHLLLVVAIVLFAAGWLVWNVLLVDSDLPPPGNPPQDAAPQ